MKYYTQVGELERAFVFRRVEDRLEVVCGDVTRVVDLATVGDGAFSLIVDGRCYDCLIDRQDGLSVVQFRGERISVLVEDERERAAHAVAAVRGGGKQFIEAVMPGVVVDVKVAEGEAVEAGQTLVVLEAMKMQNPLHAEHDGVVGKVHCRRGEPVAGGALLLEIDPPAGG